MRAYLIAVGDELLTGERQNEHATYLAARLRDYGVVVDMILVVGDQKIIQAITAMTWIAFTQG